MVKNEERGKTLDKYSVLYYAQRLASGSLDFLVPKSKHWEKKTFVASL